MLALTNTNKTQILQLVNFNWGYNFIPTAIRHIDVNKNCSYQCLMHKTNSANELT